MNDVTTAWPSHNEKSRVHARTSMETHDTVVRSRRRGQFPTVCAYRCAPSAPRLWHQWKRPPAPLYHRFHVSWVQCVVAIVIYGLLLTDVIRTGLGVANVSSLYWVLEPDSLFVLSGPWITEIGTFATPKKPTSSSSQASNQTLKLNDPLDSLVYLTNLVMMTDPIAFCRLRIFGNGVPLYLLQCKRTSRTLLVPQALVESPHDVDID
ncbi:hypothetical protein FI667_g643, partial [Globisporangium splendens]